MHIELSRGPEGITGVRRRRLRSAGAPAFGRALALVLVALATLPAGAEPLEPALRTLLATHPRILAAERAVQAAHHGIDEARSGFLPTVTLSGDTGYERIDSVTRRAAEEDPSSTGRNALVLTMTQNLFNGFRSTTQLSIARLEEESVRAEFNRTRQAILYDGIEAYLTVLRDRRLLALADRTVRTLETQLALEQQRERRGSGIAVDVLQARSRLQLARENQTTTRGRLERVEARYRELFDREPAPDSMRLPDPPVAELPVTLDAAIGEGRSANPAVERAKLDTRIASEQRTTARSSYFPKLDLVIEGSWEDDVEGVLGTRREQRVLLRGTWDLFDGFLRDARAARAAEVYGVQLNTHAAVDREVENRVRSTWVELETARRSETLAREAVDISAQVFEARQKLRLDGRETLINVLDAERERNAAEGRLIVAETDTRLAAYRLLRHTGMLTPEVLGLNR